MLSFCENNWRSLASLFLSSMISLVVSLALFCFTISSCSYFDFEISEECGSYFSAMEDVYLQGKRNEIMMPQCYQDYLQISHDIVQRMDEALDEEERNRVVEEYQEKIKGDMEVYKSCVDSVKDFILSEMPEEPPGICAEELDINANKVKDKIEEWLA